MVYGLEPWGHSLGGSGAAVGIHITWPICRLFGSMPGLAAIIASTVVLNLFARANSVSPDLMVYGLVFSGHSVGGADTGIQIIWPTLSEFRVYTGIYSQYGVNRCTKPPSQGKKGIPCPYCVPP